MTPFKKFSLLFAVPIALASAISFISTGTDDFKNTFAMTAIGGIFAIWAAAQVYIFDPFALRKQLAKGAVLAVMAVFFGVTLWGFLMLTIFKNGKFEAWIALSQGMLAVIFLVAGILAVWLLKPSQQDFHIQERLVFAVKLVLGTASFITLLFGIFSAERYFRGSLTIYQLLDEIYRIFVYAIFNATICYLLMYLLFKRFWFSRRLFPA